MSEISSKLLVKDKLMSTRTELNNNNASSLDLDFEINSVPSQRIIESASLSSASSSHSDISDDTDSTFLGDESKLSEGGADENVTKKCVHRKLRSMSDGQASSILKSDFIEAFPSLPDSVLEKLGLLGDGQRARVNEDELEQKFIALSLAFTIDAATIKDRCERQRRYRDQTETNLNTEIEKLIDKITRIQPLCMDAERAEHLTGLLAQIDVITRASSLASISAERFGAVLHEDKLAEAVNLMINHVTLLKQQRDSTRKQLQYTKKVLQDTNTADVTNIKRMSIATNGRLLTKRRASIATIAQAQDSGKPSSPTNPDMKRLTRRTSDISTRVSAFARSTRPSRLELGVDLDKIKEGIVDDSSPLDPFESSDEYVEEEVVDHIPRKQQLVEDPSTLPLTKYLIHHLKKVGEHARGRYHVYADNAVLHDFFYIAALVCFMLSVILLGNFLIEIHFSDIDGSDLLCKDVLKTNRIKS